MDHATHKHPHGCGEACPVCETQPPLRNHYFFGKLMDVPDFDVEQAYVVEKFKRHHARLHGSGVICGLEVRAHPNPACRERYLTVSPGGALDCCGNEILVMDEETLDLAAFPAVQALHEEPDGEDHLLQICIRYRECPTEEVPVLYDECGCDDTRCAPNRILESYALDVLVDPELPAHPPGRPQPPTLNWEATVGLNATVATLAHAASDRLYAAADLGDGSGMIQQYRLSTQAPTAPHTFATIPLALAANATGNRLVAGLSGGSPAKLGRLALLDASTTSAFAGAELDSFDLPDSDSADAIELLSLGGERLAALVVKGGASAVHVLDLQADDTFSLFSATASLPVIAAMALGSDGRTLYLAPENGAFLSLDSAAAAPSPQTLGIVGSGASALAVVSGPAPDLLAWTENGNRRLMLAKPDGSAISQFALAEPPVALTLDQHCFYVLMQPATTAALVQAVDLRRLLDQEPPLFSDPVAIGPRGHTLARTDSRLWVGYHDGVAVLSIDFVRCADYLRPHECPDCAAPDCVVLATIAGYRPGRRVEDPTEPPSDPLADAAAGIARIDMLTWRPFLPSVADLAQAVRCLLERRCEGGGGKGDKGDTGPAGQDGKDGKDGKDGINGKDGKDGKDGVDGKDGKDGDPGPPGEPALDPYLPHICDISWKHGGSIGVKRSTITRLTLIVTFDNPVNAADLHRNSIRLQARRPDPETGGLLQCWCDLEMPQDAITPGDTETHCDSTSAFKVVGPTGDARAVRIQVGVDRLFAQQIFSIDMRLLIQGDFIRGRHLKTKAWRALDADHLPKPDPSQPPGALPVWMSPGAKILSGDGVEGGTFESWFNLRVEG